jgi:tetratricopeptide (TPR) repeat protein
MITKSIARNFNGTTFEVEVQWHIVDSNDKVEDSLHSKIRSKLGKNNIDFKIISNTIEDFKKESITLDEDNFIKKILPDINQYLQNKQNFGDGAKNETLEMVQNEYKSDPKRAKKLLKNIEYSELSQDEKAQYYLLKFRLFNKNETVFKEYAKELKEYPTQSLELYFDYIKYLEDIRDESKPLQLIQELSKLYPISQFPDDKKGIYYYLKGRNYYLRGEFLLALKSLAEAKRFTKDKSRLADIYNSVANCFTDNLFFDEALQLATKALKIRKKYLNTDKILDSYSLIGGIYFKQNRLQESHKYFKKVIKQRSDDRIYNYLAKVNILMQKFDKADKYIKLLKDYQDKKGFSLLIKMLYLYKKNDFDRLQKLFRKKVLYIEENIVYDKFVLGWIYFFVSRIDTNYSDEYLQQSIRYFVDDNYILEAYYISKDENILIDEYIQKHQNIAQDYKDIFDIELSSTQRLSRFKDNMNGINLM